MKIGLLPVDSNYPNLALMKISSYHKGIGNQVEWYNPFDQYDCVYKSKIFSFTNDYEHSIENTCQVFSGGTGYSLNSRLDKEVEYAIPDYSIYPSIDKRTAYGFITRGCPNKCKWCVVPKKEGTVHAYMDVDDIAINGGTG